MRTLAVLTLALALAAPAAAQSPQKLFEAGKYKEAIAGLPSGGALDGEQAYLAGQARLRLKQTSDARAAFKRLASGSDSSAWTWVGRSALAQVEKNRGEALDAAKRAVSLDGKLAEAHYQLGLVYNDRGDFKQAAEAFADAAKRKPTMAYAHYYAGAANNKIKRMDRMANHFERFVKLAPDAPERPAVESMLRTTRGR